MSEPRHKDLVDRDRGQKAKALLENELLKEAFDVLEAEYIEAWKTNGVSMTPADAKIPTRLDAAGRDRLWQAYQIIGKVRGHLERVVTDGKSAERFIAESMRKDEP